ncbi:MAG: M1 family metallopeptidase [Bacteroidetes bacterium]|nr:M1 family metallopeptidase [Bacteroidota bacterium]
MKYIFFLLTFLFFADETTAQNTSNHANKFEQLGPDLPDPTPYRGVDGAPGPEYWQQRCDYDIACTLDVENQRLSGEELITYHNQSPHTLTYLWLQLDENQHVGHNDMHHFNGSTVEQVMDERALYMMEQWKDLTEYGHNIEAVTDANGSPLEFTINQTMMRVDLPVKLKPGETYPFRVKWNYKLVNRIKGPWGRGGYEYFEKDDNYIFTISQWYPRLCVYSDVTGWQNKQFTGRGEFALTFGNFNVKMTLPEDYMIGSTGECQNYDKLLTPTQLKRWKQAQTATDPVEIVTLDEAKKNEQSTKTKKTKTWVYKAENVRDFAWGASRKFVWDAMPHYNADGKHVMCMSYYPKESYPIYSRYSTRVVAHTLKTYSNYSIPYPYPVAISVEASSGMEYPMICFNFGRAEEDGTYTEGAKLGAIGVIIHEVGHNYFPMIINSDERQWSWMDEGLNTFVQTLAQAEFDNNWNLRRGPANTITGYMASPKNQLEPIMTNSDNIVEFGSNAYAKPAAGLNILRETIMGRELFDYAFKEYCQRWAFKHPTPADFFRTMEDASGVDLDWFWRGWFFGIDAVDISMDSIAWLKVDLNTDPEQKTVVNTEKKEVPFQDISKIRNRESGMAFAVEADPDLVDFYTTYRPWLTADSVQTSKVYLHDELFTKEEKAEKFGKKNYYELRFTNRGGLVMPIILEWTFEDGTTEIERIPAEIWRKNENNVTKVFVKDLAVKSVKLDPYRETADIDEKNNSKPVPAQPQLIQVYKKNREEQKPNPMQRAKVKP